MTPRAAILALVALALPFAAVAGCEVRAFTSTADGGTLNTGEGGFGIVEGDGAAAAAEPVPDAQAPSCQGSPLCAARAADCYPDVPSTAKLCDIAPDGGPYDSTAGYGDVKLACRVLAGTGAVPAPNGGASECAPGVHPECTPAGSAGDGSWCKSSAECAPTYDCVGSGTAGQGTCQHYCCSGNTECLAAQFCDIQTTVAASSIQIPVCMPIHPAGGCTLLDPTACPATETCAVVREDGSTSCVAVGAAKAGQSCDYDHCAANLVCLGTPGQRLCYQLCHTATSTSAAECPASSSQTCKGGLPLFPDPSVGICQ